MRERLETAPVANVPDKVVEPLPWSMDSRRRILSAISDPAVQKILVMRWRENLEIWEDEAELLIREYGLEGA